MKIGFLDSDGNDIHVGDKMVNTLCKGTVTYEVKSYKGNWWLFDKNIPWMMLIPSCNSNKIAQYKVI